MSHPYDSKSGLLPADAPLAMPKQVLNTLNKTQTASIHKGAFLHRVKTWLARLLTFGGALGITAYACYEILQVVSVSSITLFQWCMVVMFTITFAWIALAATGALAGVFFGQGRLRASKKADPATDITTRTVLLMPVYNEDPCESFSALAAMAADLKTIDCAKHFEMFVISDTNNPDNFAREAAAIAHLKVLLPADMPVWYRRRKHNSEKKAGNVANFVRRFGGRYDYMLVLDADSTLSASTLVTLVREMQADTRCGILQTLPKLYGGNTLLSRLQQFAGYMYGDIVARGITAWQGCDGNYWGHNALIRMQAFASSAGLPILKGNKPFGGEVLSHDFVEAAFIRRAGWSVRMLPQLPGSWEQGPPTLRDIAVRDRRWSQGNLQHLAVIRAKGLTWSNRAHMCMGVMSYFASIFWLMLIGVGLITYYQVSRVQIDYFKDDYSIIPTWPVFDTERMVHLFIFTMGILLLPKVIGLTHKCLIALFTRPWRIPFIVVSVVIETFFSMLYAPIFMCIHSKQIVEILRGVDSGWHTQQRNASRLAIGVYFKNHFGHTLIGAALVAALFYFSKPLLAWMSPTLIGLVLAIPLAMLSGSKWLASLLRFFHLLLIPEERTQPNVLIEQTKYARTLEQNVGEVSLHDILTRPDAYHRHISVVSQPLAPERGQPDMASQGVVLKLAEAASVDEFLSWLTPREKLALLSDPSLCQSVFEQFTTV